MLTSLSLVLLAVQLRVEHANYKYSWKGATTRCLTFHLSHYTSTVRSLPIPKRKTDWCKYLHEDIWFLINRYRTIFGCKPFLADTWPIDTSPIKGAIVWTQTFNDVWQIGRDWWWLLATFTLIWRNVSTSNFTTFIHKQRNSRNCKRGLSSQLEYKRCLLVLRKPLFMYRSLVNVIWFGHCFLSFEPFLTSFGDHNNTKQPI